MPPLFNSLIAWASEMSLEGPCLSSLPWCVQVRLTAPRALEQNLSRRTKQAEIPSDAHRKTRRFQADGSLLAQQRLQEVM